MSLIWLEAMLPLGIIAGMLCIMGNAQYYIHTAAHGRVISLSICLISDPKFFHRVDSQSFDFLLTVVAEAHR